MEKTLTLHPTNHDEDQTRIRPRAFDVDLAECHKAFITLFYRCRIALPDLQNRN